MMDKREIHKYEYIWVKIRQDILDTIEKGEDLEIDLNENDFKSVGKRKSYSFNLEFNNSSVFNNINGSAVARDLSRVLLRTLNFKKAAKEKHIKLRMNKYFKLIISIHNL